MNHRICSAMIAIGCLGAFSMLWSAPAAADDRDDAKRHFDAGLALLEAEDWSGAAVEFETSVRLYPTKNGWFNLANCHRAMHRWGDALFAVDVLEKEFAGQLDDEWKATIADFRDSVEGLVAWLTVEADADGVRVSLNGGAPLPVNAAVPFVLGPGTHVVEVSCDDCETRRRSVRLTAGARHTEHFEMEKKAPPPLPGGTLPGSALPGGTPAPVAEEPAPESPSTVQPAPPSADGSREDGGTQSPRPRRNAGIALVVVGTAAACAAGTLFVLAGVKNQDLAAAENDLDSAEASLESNPSSPILQDRVVAAKDNVDELESRKTALLGAGIAVGITAVALVVTGAVLIAGDKRRHNRGRVVRILPALSGMTVTF